MQPVKKILLQLDSKYTDEIITEGGLKFYLDASYNPEWNVTVTGKVAGVPAKIKEVAKGDEVAFSYRIVEDKKQKDNRDYFIRIVDGSDYFQQFQNPQGEVLTVVAYPGPISVKWAGVYADKNGDLINGVQGTQSEVERWKAQFKFGSNEDMVYQNLIEIDGKDYWLAEIDQIFALKRGDEIETVGDYVLCEPIKIDLTEKVNLMQGLSLPPMSIPVMVKNQATVVAGAHKGEVVCFEEQYAEKYELWGKKYFILKNKRLLAKV